MKLVKINGEEVPACYGCKHRRELSYSRHSMCAADCAKVVGHKTGIKHGWFLFPFNFDPVWLEECDSFDPVDGAEDVQE